MDLSDRDEDAKGIIAHFLSECAFIFSSVFHLFAGNRFFDERKGGEILRIGIIGGGKVGCSLARIFLKNELLVGVVGSDVNKSRQLAAEYGLPPLDRKDVINESDVLLLTVPDRKIGMLARELADGGILCGKIFFHCSGSLSLEALAPLTAQGAHVGSFHPLQSFAGKTTELQGVYIAAAGDGKALAAAEALARYVGGRVFSVPSEERPLYHAAACICSNYTVTVAALAQRLMSRWLGDERKAWEALKPLFAGTARNLLAAEKPEAALTGPIARGDTETVAGHLAVLPEEAQEMYRILGKAAAELAAGSGSIDEKKFKEIKTLLERKEE